MKPAAEAFDVGRKFVRVLRATGKPVTAAEPGRPIARERRPTMYVVYVASARGQVWCWAMMNGSEAPSTFMRP